LIISADGDYLRGRVLQLDEEHLTVELRLEPVSIPRRLVAAVISLTERGAAAPEDATEGMQVQAVTREGGRWTLRVTDIDQEHLVGSNVLLDGIRLEMSGIGRLLLNAAIGDDLKQAGAGSGMGFFGWSLRDAPDPQVFADAAADKADAAGGDRQPTGGTASRLVGQPAPDFELPLLDGGNFRLQDQLGKIVILDFWATWCGPCIQTMPEVERIVHQIDDPRIRLVAVNLQEPPPRVRATLERLEWDLEVALDETGQVAGIYEARAIPQTVIIDPQGRIHRLYVGGGGVFLRNLEQSLRELVTSLD
jgi:peroxiredoxin